MKTKKMKFSSVFGGRWASLSFPGGEMVGERCKYAIFDYFEGIACRNNNKQ